MPFSKPKARLETLAMGLDSGMGMLHADLKSRDSFDYDLLEDVCPDQAHSFGSRPSSSGVLLLSITTARKLVPASTAYARASARRIPCGLGAQLSGSERALPVLRSAERLAPLDDDELGDEIHPAVWRPESLAKR